MDIFQEVKNQISTELAYNHYTGELKRKGRIHWGLCPWHREKTSSFAVFDDGGFKCFGCSQGGSDAIAFVAKLFNLSMIDAAKKLISDFSLPIEIGKQTTSYKSNPDEVTYSDFMIGLNQWRDKTFDNLCRLYRLANIVLKTSNTDDESFADLVLCNADLDDWTDILIYGDMLEIFGLYKNIKDKGWR